jgi:predicted helicase
LIRYAKRGEEQDGIDIIDQLGSKPLFAIQCKHHERTKTIPPQEIEDQVSRAEASSQPVDRYIIATTAKKSRRAQDTVLKLNERESRPFSVEIHFWEDICAYLDGFGKAHAELSNRSRPGKVFRVN